MPVYLVATEPEHDPAELVERMFDDAHRVRAGLWLVDARGHQSRVYHDVKWGLPDDAPLLVARLDHQPKFKGAQKGLLAWARERYEGMTA